MIRVIGNNDLLNLPKTAYFCSDKYSSAAVLLSYDWAADMVKSKRCVISGFQSKMEQDVLDILLRGNGPIILVLARCIFKKCPSRYLEAVKQGRMLIISPFDDDNPVITRERAFKRNQYAMDLADDVVVAHITPGGMLERILADCTKQVILLEKQ